MWKVAFGPGPRGFGGRWADPGPVAALRSPFIPCRTELLHLRDVFGGETGGLGDLHPASGCAVLRAGVWAVLRAGVCAVLRGRRVGGAEGQACGRC